MTRFSWIVAAFVAAVTASAFPASPTTLTLESWRLPEWSERYCVAFDDLRAESGAEVAVVRMRPGWEQRKDPYDIRAFDDEGTTLPVRVVTWSERGEVTCLVGISTAALSRGRVPGLDLYLGNPEAPPASYEYPWRSPRILLGSRLKRAYRRHGEWRWNSDPVFGSVHIGVNTDVPPTRTGHSLTGLESISCHPRHMRIVQMVWLDPASPPEAIAVDFLFDRQIISAYWTNADAAPDDPMPDSTPRRIGALPAAGRWVRLDVTTEQLHLEKRNTLRGIGFSNHGGLVRWGPTALGAMPTYGYVIARQALNIADGATSAPVDVPILPVSEGPAMQPQYVRFDMVEAPLFVEEKRPLTFTFFASPSFRFTGEMQDCPVEVVTIPRDEGAGGREKIVRRLTAAFPGGDNWQQSVELTPEEWAGAARVEGRLVVDGKSTPTAVLRLESLGHVPGLRANGSMLEAGGAAVTYVLPTSPAPALASSDEGGSATLVLTDIVRVLADPAMVSVNSNDTRLGLAMRPSLYERRTPAEWLVAISSAIADREFGRVHFLMGPNLADTGLAYSEAPLFIRGAIQLAQSASGLSVSMNLGPLRETRHTERGRALLAACLAGESLMDSGEVPEPSAKPEEAR